MPGIDPTPQVHTLQGAALARLHLAASQVCRFTIYDPVAEVEALEKRIAELERQVDELEAALLDSSEREKSALREFVAEVERRAEAKMLHTGKLEGAHYAAMKQIIAEKDANNAKR